MAESVRETAHAKTNLRLRVLEREESGFHGLESIFLRLALADEVILEEGGEGIRLTVEAAEPDPPEAQRGLFGEGRAGELVDPVARVPEGEDNLCWIAARRFFSATDREPSVSIRLRKRIPAGAGLGGGSADAAAVLRGLQRLRDEDLPPDRLASLAGELGSDVPFALSGAASALGWERGRRILPLPAPETRPVLVLMPAVRVSTPDAYGWVDEARADRREAAGGGAVLPDPDRLSDWDALGRLQTNDFEEPVFARHPELGWWKEELLGEGADLAFLSGSGSALCAVFPDARRRDAAAERARESEEVGVIRTRGPV